MKNDKGEKKRSNFLPPYKLNGTIYVTVLSVFLCINLELDQIGWEVAVSSPDITVHLI